MFFAFILTTLATSFVPRVPLATGLTCRQDLDSLLGQPPDHFFSSTDSPPARDFSSIVGVFEGIRKRLIERGIDPGHAPYVLTHNRRTKRVVVLVHGLLGTPLQMHPLAEAYYKRGYNVVVTLLDGHGISRYELARLSQNPKVLVDRFKNTLRFSSELAATLGDEIILSGFSLGGALALKVALIGEVNPIALSVIAPAIKEHPFARRVATPKFKEYAKWRDTFADEIAVGMVKETDNPHFFATSLPNGILDTEFVGGAYSQMPSATLPLIPELSERLLSQLALAYTRKIPTHILASEADLHIDGRVLTEWAESLSTNQNSYLLFPKSDGVDHLGLLLGQKDGRFYFEQQVDWVTTRFPAN